MKRLIISSILLMALLPALSYGQNPEIAFRLLKEGNGRMLSMLCDPVLTGQIDSKGLSELWKNIETELGQYISNGEWAEYPGVKNVMYSNVTFGNNRVAMLIAYNTAGKINGIQIAPPVQDRAVPDGENITLTTVNGLKLNGILRTPQDCIPEETPAVVLVHGSGPNDMDETMGPNAIFREIADSLSQKGISVLRYDKRTFAHGSAAFSDPAHPTIEEECTDDVCTAVKFLKSRGFGKIFIAGHSLGASLAPLIAYNDTTGNISGIIMIAAPARRMDVILEDQLSVIAPYNSPENLDALRNQFDNLPAEYKKQVDYDKKSVFETLVSGNFPIMVIQGERDYQVTMEDFALWKEWAGNVQEEESDYVVFRSYRDVNHILHKAEGMPSPLEYSEAGSIPSEIISDITMFIREHQDSATPVPSEAVRHLQE